MLPSFNELIEPVLKLISSNPLTRKKATCELQKNLKISQQQMDQKTNSGTFIFESRVGWAFTYLLRPNILKKPIKKLIMKLLI